MGKNVIIIMIDGGRLDYALNSPVFTKLKSASSFFSQTITYGPHTIAAMHAVFSGCYGNRTGTNSYWSTYKFKQSKFKTLTEYLHENGYHTESDLINELILPRQGFDEFHIHEEQKDNLVTKHSELVKASREALDEAIKLVKPGVEVRKIGEKIHEIITSYGFSPVRNLCGHGVGPYQIHTIPSLPNFDNGNTTKLEKDQVIAIEPFASTGAGLIYERGDPTVFELANKKPVRSMITRQVLKEIEGFKGLPFTLRWLTKKFGEPKVKFALREMRQMKMLREHPALLDKNHGLVSQAEHTMIVKDKVVITTKL